MNCKRSEAVEVLKNHRRNGGGRIFTVVFIKRTNGEKRVMNARFGVHKYVKGEEGKGLGYEPEDKGLIGCYDVTKDPGQGYRMISIESIISAKVDGQEYIIEEPVLTPVC